ncbi:oligopeptide/dipeptide ABC transporter ATP-binding protein [Nonomuraea sp. NPDC050328]|uniref:oligopeptide/dipeptide ABC transporter ATP-binding protein n=1 Tax=Nonomuraea sp. NPDC050328 TaxID=3364361 RepID=UPI0037B4C5D4
MTADLPAGLPADPSDELPPGVLLSVRGLGVGLGGRPIVDGVDLTVGAGETVGLVGESGSGKSLTARAVAGLLPPGLTATGSIRLAAPAGRPGPPVELAGAPERVLRKIRGRRIGLLMQDPFAMLNPLLTAGAHLAETLPRPARGEVTQRLAEVGITDPDVARRYPFQLSGGMRQRVAIAAALAGDPELLIADEPTTALDATIQHEIMQLLARIQAARGMAVLLITHDLRVAFELCDRVQVMYAGRVLETGSAKALATGPSHPYTLGLINALPAVERTAVRLEGIPGSVPRAADVAGQCAFAERCAQRRDDCLTARPPLRPAGAGRLTACLHEVVPRPVASAPEGPAAAAREPSAQPLLLVEGLRKQYGTAVALAGVDLRIEPGERLGLVGESGSGKTTLARCLLGLTEPSGGRITFQPPGTPRHRVVQCVFQDPSTSLNPAMPVGATLAEAAGRAAPGERRSPGELLELVGLPAAYATLRPHRLSGGEKQRVAIARALAVRPELLICDEPTASLDVSVQAHILELLRTVSAELGTALLFVTHDLAVVRQITDRIVVLLHGRVVESGPTAAVLDSPDHDYTRRLVASVPPAPALTGRDACTS